LVAARNGLLLKERELESARPAPRSPLVDHHRMAVEVSEALLERVDPARQELIRLLAQRGELRRRVGKRRRRLLDGQRGIGIAGAVVVVADQDDHDNPNQEQGRRDCDQGLPEAHSPPGVVIFRSVPFSGPRGSVGPAGGEETRPVRTLTSLLRSP
jgi:hypothetical protein